ncbi:MAG: hypothetical protein QW726_05365 [Fervidicoccaceae archaeon]
MAVASISPALTMLLMFKFINIERNRNTGEVYMDEIISLFLLGLVLALLFRLIFEALEFFGVPVQSLTYATLYCNANYGTNPQITCNSLWDAPTINACSTTDLTDFTQYSNFAVSIVSALSRLFIIFAPLFAMTIAGWKIYTKHAKQNEERKQGPIYTGVRVAIDILALSLVILFFVKTIYSFIYIDYTALVDWYFKNIATFLQGGQA